MSEGGAPQSWGKLRGWFASPKAPRAALGAALLLLLPSLTFGLRMDDRVHRILARGDPAFPWMTAAPHRLFDFFSSAEVLARYREHGLAAWFADPDCRVNFFRPLSSVIHWVEHRYWGDQPWLMHGLSIAVYLALVAAACALYRRLWRGEAGAAEALGLSAWMYAVDQTHGIPAGWVAQRNSLLAALFGVLAVVAHDRWRRDGERRAALFGPPLLLLSLLSAEAGTATCGALLAHAATLERPGQRLRALLPYLLAVAPWAALYIAGDFGARGSGMYLSVRQTPLASLGAAAQHFVALLGTELGNPLTDVWPMVSRPVQLVALCVSALLLLCLLVAARPLLARSAEARFLALASAISLTPACLTVPQSRLLLFVGVFQIGLLGRLASALARGELRGSRPQKAAALVVAGSTLAHIFASPLLLVTTSKQMVDFERALGALSPGLPDQPVERLVVPNAPNMAFVGYASLLASAAGKAPPGRLTALANGTRRVTLVGVDERSLRVQSEGGFVHDVTDALLRSPSSLIPVGAVFEQPGVTFTITHADAQGRADEALVRLDRPLTDPAVAFRRWTRRGLEPMEPPAPGQTIEIAAQSFVEAVIDASQGKGPPTPGL